AGRAARSDARGDGSMAEPRVAGAADAARDRSRSAQPADAHQGVRPVGAAQARRAAADRRGEAARTGEGRRIAFRVVALQKLTASPIDHPLAFSAALYRTIRRVRVTPMW